MENIVSWILIPEMVIFWQFPWESYQATKFHGESCFQTTTTAHSQIFVFFMGNFSNDQISRKTTFYPNNRVSACEMDQRRLLPGGPSSSEGSTVGPRFLSLLPRLD